MTEILRRPGRLVLAVLLVLVLFVMGECDKGDNSGRDYKPRPGDHVWR